MSSSLALNTTSELWQFHHKSFQFLDRIKELTVGNIRGRTVFRKPASKVPDRFRSYASKLHAHKCTEYKHPLQHACPKRSVAPLVGAGQALDLASSTTAF